jgi:hypothetical protein
MPFPIINSIASWVLKQRIHQIELFLKYPHEVQDELLAHAKLLSKAKRNAAPHLKDLMGPWLNSIYDFNKDISRVALDSFNVGFFLFSLMRVGFVFGAETQ